MTNAGPAAGLRAQADDHLNARRILLTASVALATSSTPAAAITAVRRSGIPLQVRDEVAALIEGLGGD
jgi:hypothetical protein